MAPRHAHLLLIGAVLLLPACAVNGLAFEHDDRVQITSPEPSETVILPFRITWSADRYEGRFLVLIDRHPMRPGQPLLALVPEDDSCRSLPDCPTQAWLTDHQAFVTDKTSIELKTLPDLRPNPRSADRHEVVIVLLNDEGRRQSESAFVREFIVSREQ